METLVLAISNTFENRKGSGDIVVTFAIHVGNATGAYIQKEDVDPLELQVSQIEDNLLVSAFD